MMRSAVVIISLFAAFSLYCNGEEEKPVAATIAAGPPEAGVPWLLVADPPKLERITELLPYTVNFSLSYTGDGKQPAIYATPDTVFVVNISTSNSMTAALSSDRIEFTWQDVVEGNNMTLTVTGRVIGYVDLIFAMDILTLSRNGSASAVAETVTKFPRYSVTVVRASEIMDNVFTM